MAETWVSGIFSLDIVQSLLAAGVAELGVALALWDWSRMRPQSKISPVALLQELAAKRFIEVRDETIA
jgi:hypothetical protein